jgi:prepilin-type processing-associated H-X9-DG protein
MNNLGQQINGNASVEDASNMAVRTTIVKLYVCPSDRSTGVFTMCDKDFTPLADAATNSYAACQGSGADLGEELDEFNGMFSRNSHVRLTDVTDGTSSTLAIGERGAFFTQTLWAGAISLGTPRVTPGAPTSNPSATEDPPTQTLGHVAVHALNDLNSDPEDFFSPHTGSGNFLFGDGSVRPIRSGTSVSVLQALASRNGGELISPDDY